MERTVGLICTILGIIGYSFICYLGGFKEGKTHHESPTIQCPCKAPE
jgi:hypothetical protein